MTEFSSARLDYLVQRVERPGEMTEIFDGRCDRLYRRHVTFEQQAEEGGEQDEKKKEEEEEEYDDGRTEMKIPQVAAVERGSLNDGRGSGGEV